MTFGMGASWDTDWSSAGALGFGLASEGGGTLQKAHILGGGMILIIFLLGGYWLAGKWETGQDTGAESLPGPE